MTNDHLNKVLRNKILWVEIELMPQERVRMRQQFEKVQTDLLNDIKKRMDEAQEIRELLDYGEISQ